MPTPTVRAALHLGDRLLAEHCETGDATSTAALEHTVEVVAEALAARALAAGEPERVRHLVLPTQPGVPEPPHHADQISCHALASRLRELHRELSATEHTALAELAPTVGRLSRAVEEHALGLAELASLWTADAPQARAVRGARETTRLHRILLAECRAVLRAVDEGVTP